MNTINLPQNASLIYLAPLHEAHDTQQCHHLFFYANFPYQVKKVNKKSHVFVSCDAEAIFSQSSIVERIQ